MQRKEIAIVILALLGLTFSACQAPLTVAPTDTALPPTDVPPTELLPGEAPPTEQPATMELYPDVTIFTTPLQQKGF